MNKEEVFRKNTPDTEPIPPEQGQMKPPAQNGQNQEPRPPQQNGQNQPTKPPNNNQQQRPPQQNGQNRPPRPPRPPQNGQNPPPRPPRPPQYHTHNTNSPRPPYHVHYPYQPPKPPIIIQPIPQVQQGSNTSYVRFLNVIAGGPNVDVYLDGTLIVSNLAYGMASNYATITSDVNLNHRVVVYQAGIKGNPILQTQLPINRGSVYTAALGGVMPYIGLQSISIQRMEIPTQMAIFRFAHLSPNNTAIDVKLNGQKVFTCVPYWNTTSTIGLYTGAYTIELLPCGSQTPFYTMRSTNIGTGAYTLYAIGILDGSPPFQTILLKD